jgi:hypothetical protein
MLVNLEQRQRQRQPPHGLAVLGCAVLTQHAWWWWWLW